MPLSLRPIPVDRIVTDETERPPPKGLSASMAAFGMRIPIYVREHEDGSFQLSEGSQRLATARALRWPVIDAIVLPAAEADLPKDLEAIIINTQRHNLEQLYVARHARRLMQEGYTQARIGRLIGRSQAALSSMIKVLDCADLVSAIVDDALQFGSARALAALPPADRGQLLDEILDRAARDEKFPSVRCVEAMVQQRQGHPPRFTATPENLAPVLRELQALGVPLEIQTSRGKKDKARVIILLSEETEAALCAALDDVAASSSGDPPREDAP